MANNVSDLLLDGNVAAGLLQRIFLPDITLAKIRCDSCECVCDLGSLALHASPMGAVLKCSACESDLMRAVDTPYGLWLEMTGAQYLRFQR
jgi:hypothetical protein